MALEVEEKTLRKWGRLDFNIAAAGFDLLNKSKTFEEIMSKKQEEKNKNFCRESEIEEKREKKGIFFFFDNVS